MAARVNERTIEQIRERTDIVEVIGSRDSPEPPVIRHIEDAFRFPIGRIFTKRA